MSLARLLPESIKKRLAPLLWHGLHLETTLPSGMTVRINSRGDWLTFVDIFVNGEYDMAINMALDRMPTGQPLQVLDLGANVGMFALRLFDLARQRNLSLSRINLLMVEGSAKCCEEIKRRLPSLPYGLACGLVGKRAGSAFLDESRESVMNTIGESGTVASYIDLADFIQAPIDLLKCDIEGSEQSFLENYPELTGQTSVAVFELHTEMCDARRCRQMLSGFPNHRLISSHGAQSVEMFWR